MAGRGRIENLRPWKPGQSGNPSGRPKRLPVSDRYREQMEMALPPEVCAQAHLKPGSKFGDLLARGVIMRAATKGDAAAAKEVTDRIEGRAPLRLELEDRPEPKVVSPSAEMTSEQRREFMLNNLMRQGHSAERAAHILKLMLFEDD